MSIQKNANAEIKVTENNGKRELRMNWEPISIENYTKVARENSVELAKKFSTKFRSIFHDYVGCNIFVGNNMKLEMELFFEMSADVAPEGKINNLVDLSSGRGVDRTNVFDGMQFINQKFSSKRYKLNAETRELLSDIMYGGRQANKPTDEAKWAKHEEIRSWNANGNSQNVMYGRSAERQVLRVTGIDINKVAQRLYGDTTVIETTRNDNNETINRTAYALYQFSG